MDSSKKRILFVDDDEDICVAMTEVLGLSGYEVTPAQSLAVGLSLAKARRFDLYILDQKFPDGSGIDLCRQIREFDPETPILFYSAYAREVDREAARAAGAQDYLKKPTSLDHLEESISTLLSLVTLGGQDQPQNGTRSENHFDSVPNRILAALPAEEYERLLPHLEHVSLEPNEVLYRPDEPIRYVYFPLNTLVSLVSLAETGATVEVGVVGNEGMVGMPVFLGAGTTPHLALVQAKGNAMRMKAEVLKQEFERKGVLHDLLLRYVNALFIQASQSATCNRLHTIESQLCRWLLTTQDRLQTDRLELTQEFISRLLGARRSGVTVAAGHLQKEGLISYSRGKIAIRDRQRLEAAACECYRVIKSEFNRLLNV